VIERFSMDSLQEYLDGVFVYLNLECRDDYISSQLYIWKMNGFTHWTHWLFRKGKN
jgi:hypothetical protein